MPRRTAETGYPTYGDVDLVRAGFRVAGLRSGTMGGMEFMSYRRVRLPVLAAVSLLTIAAVLIVLRWDRVDDEGRAAERPEAAATNRAMAAMLIDRVDRAPTSQGPVEEIDDYPKGSIGAIVNFDSDVLSLSGLATGSRSVFRRDRCDAPDNVMDGCRQRRLEDGSVLRVAWQKVVPEEDPGIVSLMHRRDKQVTALGVSGPEITGDPASMDDLPIAFDDLVDLVTDPAFGVRTSQRYVDDGADLDEWGR